MLRVNLGPVTNGAGDESGPHYDGKKLTFDRDGDIYESTGSGTSWTAPSNTPFVNVNTGGFEDSPSISQDGQVMYFGRNNKLFRSEKSDGVWGTGSDIELRTVDVHIRRLRKALELEGAKDPIRTVRSAGYAIEAV